MFTALPQGWEAKMDMRTGRIFYVDHNTKRTTWERPAPPALPEALQSQSSSESVGGGVSPLSLAPPQQPQMDRYGHEMLSVERPINSSMRKAVYCINDAHL